MTVGLALWAVAVILMSAPLFAYRVEYSALADVFVAACLLATTTGYLTVRTKATPAPSTYRYIHKEILVAKLLAMLGISGCVLLLIDAQSRGLELSVAYLLENLSSSRAAAFDRLNDSSVGTPLAALGSVLAPCCSLSVIAAVRFGRAGGRSLVALGAASFLFVATAGLFVYSGRSMLVYAGLLGLISLYISGKRVLRFRPTPLLVAVAIAAGGWYFSVAWLENREGGVQPEEVLRLTQRAEYRPWVAPIARNNHALGVGLISLGYFASPLPALSFYVEQGTLPGPFWGQYSFPIPAGIVRFALGPDTLREWIDIRQEVFLPFEAVGYAGNVWATWLRDLLIDFGYLGALVFCSLFGAFMAWARNAFQRTGRVHYHWCEVIACLTFGFGAFVGLLFFGLLSIAFFGALAISIWSAMFQPKVVVRRKTA